jgi:hypothetical protein
MRHYVGIWFDKEELDKIMALAPLKGKQVRHDRPPNVLESLIEALITFLEFTKSALNDLLD